MREILFRGQTRRYGEKVKLNGEKIKSNWVYGGYGLTAREIKGAHISGQNTQD